MATVLKNLTNLFTILGDYTMYGKVRSMPHCVLPCYCLTGFGFCQTHMQQQEECYMACGAGVRGRGMGVTSADVRVGHLRLLNGPGV